MSSSSGTPKRFQGSRGNSSSSSSSSSSSYRYQKKYVPKGTTDDGIYSSSSRDPSISAADSTNDSSANPHPTPGTLNSALRESSARPVSKEKRGAGRRGGGGGDGHDRNSYVNYLPHDEAVASGLGADAGGLDAIESQSVVDHLNDRLSDLLKMSPRDFWREVARNDSLHEFLDSYLQFRHRWYDFPHHGAREAVAGVIVGELELCRRVFMVLYRISSNKDPGARSNNCLSMKEHTALLQEKKLLDLPKLLDICAIYGHDNAELTRSLVDNAIKAQPKLLDHIDAVVSHLLNIVHTMHERCSSSLEVLIASGEHEIHGYGQLSKDFLEVMDFINDAIVTLDAFADAYMPAAFYFVSFEMSHTNEDLPRTLARLHDSLLPSLHKGLQLFCKTSGSTLLSPDKMLADTVLSIRLLSMRIVNFGWKLLDFCFLNGESIDNNLLQNTAKMFPSKVDDPAIRSDILIQTFKDLNGEASYQFLEKNDHVTFLQNIEKKFKILERIDSLRVKGWIFMDNEQFQYLSQIATPPHMKTWKKESETSISSLNGKAQIDEDTIMLESKISQIKDIFPDYGKGFLLACLEAYNQNAEEVIQRILEGNLHEDLLSLDTSLEHVPAPKQATISKSDKGKGILLESAPEKTVFSNSQPKVPSRDENGTSSSSSLYGRYTRKSDADVPESAILDSKAAKDSIRSVVLAAEFEYEDEYDDSFDDLGLSVVGSGYEETENATNITETSSTDYSSRESNSKWGPKKTQFYVKDGKNYSYKVAGSISVSSAQDAAIVNQAQKEVIYGLGRGGNLPLGAVKKLVDAEVQENQTADVAENSGRGHSNSRGRGGRRGGGNHYRKDRAMKKHFSGLGGF